jgi:hypothetical protein
MQGCSRQVPCGFSPQSRPPGSSRSSELFRQEFSADSFLKPPTVFHTSLVDDPPVGLNGETADCLEMLIFAYALWGLQTTESIPLNLSKR